MLSKAKGAPARRTKSRDRRSWDRVESGEIGLDTPIGRYLPQLVPGERGNAITVRMLINHTSGLADYLPYAYPSLKAFPSLKDTTPQSLDDNRFTRFHPIDLIALGVRAPAVGKPGGTPGNYSNTNYQLLCQLLERATGMSAGSASGKVDMDDGPGRNGKGKAKGHRKHEGKGNRGKD